MDVMADPKYRGGPAYKIILKRIMTEIAGKVQWYGFANAVSHTIFRRYFRKIIIIDEKISVLISPINASSYLPGNRFVKRLAGYISINAHKVRLSMSLQRSIDVYQSREVGSEFDDLWKKTRDEYGWIPHRGKDFIQWRYLLDPARNYQIWKAVEGGKIIGNLVTTVNLEHGRKRGLLIDWLVAPQRQNVAKAMLSKAMKWFVEQKVDMVEVLLPDHERRMNKIFKSFFFLRSEHPRRYLMGKGPADDDLRVEDLFITIGDSDYLAPDINL